MKKVLWLAIALSCPLLTAGLCLAQIPRAHTAPQILAGSAQGLQFVTSLTLQNPTLITCPALVRFHRGAGAGAGVDLLVNGEDAGTESVFIIPPGGVARLDATTGDGSFFQGAASIEDGCGRLTVTAGYRIRSDTPGSETGPFQEVFFYDASFRGLLEGQVGRAPIQYDPTPTDGAANIPGLAVVGDRTTPLPANSEFCQVVSDAEDAPLTDTICEPYDGHHQAMLLTDVFPDLQGPIDNAQWRFWLNSPGSTARIYPLVIDVSLPDQFRAAPVTVANPRCLQEELCLQTERFRVSAEANPGTMTFSGLPRKVEDGFGYFIFPQLSGDNFEMPIQIVDACRLNGHFWVFSGSLTSVGYTIRVTDTVTGEVREYMNTQGSPAQPIVDTEAFATCP